MEEADNRDRRVLRARRKRPPNRRAAEKSDEHDDNTRISDDLAHDAQAIAVSCGSSTGMLVEAPARQKYRNYLTVSLRRS